jgi:glutathione S-transferase
MDLSEWLSKKPDLKEKNPLMNLPYVIHGDRVVTQSNACFSYLGRLLNLWGQTEDEVVECEELLCEVMDIRNHMVQFAYGGKCDLETATTCLRSMGGPLKKLELWLERRVAAGASGTFLVGESATAPDFHLYEMLLQVSAVAEHLALPSPLAAAASPRLKTFADTFRELPGNARFLASNIGSEAPLGLPFNNKMAAFGADNVSNGRWVPGQEYTFNSFQGLY